MLNICWKQSKIPDIWLIAKITANSMKDDIILYKLLRNYMMGMKCTLKL